MPRQTTRTTPPSRPPANGGRNGGGNGPKPTTTRTTRNGGNGNGRSVTAWPISLVLAAEVELAVEGEDSTIDGFAVCTRCAAVLPGNEISRKLHERHHEQIDSHDAR
jgi:hypothetical protein